MKQGQSLDMCEARLSRLDGPLILALFFFVDTVYKIPIEGRVFGFKDSNSSKDRLLLTSLPFPHTKKEDQAIHEHTSSTVVIGIFNTALTAQHLGKFQGSEVEYTHGYRITLTLQSYNKSQKYLGTDP